MMEVIDRSVEELNLPVEESIDTPKYREAYAELMRTSKSTRNSGLTYLGFLLKMRGRNVARRKEEFLKRSVSTEERNIISMKPINKRVLIRPKEEESVTKGGIFIPDMAKEKPYWGVVVDVADDCKLGIKKDDVVIFGRYSGTEIKSGESSCLLIQENEILAIAK